MRRLLPVALMTVWLLAWPAVPAQANNPTPVGGENNGTYFDNHYLANSHEMSGDWIRAAQSASERGELDAYIFAHDLPSYNGHNVCLQVALDWESPQGESHYDSRVWRTCEPNHQWNPTKLLEPLYACYRPVQVPCDMPLKRVQFAKYVPDTGALLGEECRDFGDGKCDGWEPRCGFQDSTPTACYVVWRRRDGTTDKLGSLDSDDVTNPDH